MRTPSAGEHRIELIADEGHIRYTTDFTAKSWTRLIRWKMVNDGGAHTSGVDLGDASGEATRIGSNRCRNLWTLSYRRMRSTEATFGHIELAIRPKLQAAWIIETCSEDRNSW